MSKEKPTRKVISRVGPRLWGRYVTAWRFNAKQYCLGFYSIWSGARCVNAAIENMSLHNKTDRRRIRRVANELIALCDAYDKQLGVKS